jgi:hypothetical protein
MWNQLSSYAHLRQYFHVSRHFMSIIKTIKFLFMSHKARSESIMRKVENMSNRGNILTDKSHFEFTGGGFSLHTTGKFYSWTDIEEVSAYKVDLITTDDICLDISFQDFILTISEEVPGFPLFIEKLIEALPGIDGDWEAKVIKPPFATNQTIIYKREHPHG